MADSILSTVQSLTTSLKAANESVPAYDAVQPPEDGITLLDAKNEIFLSYIQSLALRNLETIRSVRYALETKTAGTSSSKTHDEIVQDLIRHRVYLERGVRPLEERLKYQIDKVVRAAEEEETRKIEDSKKKTKSQVEEEEEEDDSEESGSGSEEEEDTPDELSYRPNPGAFTRPAASKAAQDQNTRSNGVYRPPRVTATTMPSLPSTFSDRREKTSRPSRSATLDEFVRTELSSAPAAEPSIGSTIVAGGRRDKSARERAKEAERTEYEETNLVRLPGESKKEKAKRAGRDRQFGGEEWRGLGEGLDRIENLTKRKGGTGSALERSRKRKTIDGPRDDGRGAGGEFEKRRKRVMKKMR